MGSGGEGSLGGLSTLGGGCCCTAAAAGEGRRRRAGIWVGAVILPSENGHNFDTFAMSSWCTRGGRSFTASSGIKDAFNGEEELSVDAGRRRMSVSKS